LALAWPGQLEIEVRSGSEPWNHALVTGDLSGGEAEFLLAGPGQLADVLSVLDFAYRGDFTVAGAPGQRLGNGPVTVVSRYELGLTQRRHSACGA
jgi:hypothetical protein